jgi:inosine-uridine nucleoside N-ribohydrolase
MKKSIWLDCDPGHDDAMALILAAFDPALELIGVSTVAGNQSLAKTTANARALLLAFGLSRVPLFAGMSRALSGPMPFCAEIHGVSGLDGLDGQPLFPWSPESPSLEFQPWRWMEILREMTHQTGRKVEWVSTGSLTNLALLVLLFPDLHQWVRVSLMGGAIGPGNTGPVSEFNIQNDPEAAQIVFDSGLEITMVPLEVTHTVLADANILHRIGQHTPMRKKVVELLRFFESTYRNVFGFDAPPLHDPVAVFFPVAEDAFQTQKMRVDVERANPLSRGQTICDPFHRNGGEKNVAVALKVDVSRFWTRMLEALDKAESAWCLMETAPEAGKTK